MNLVERLIRLGRGLRLTPVASGRNGLEVVEAPSGSAVVLRPFSLSGDANVPLDLRGLGTGGVTAGGVALRRMSVCFHAVASSQTTWTNMPAADTFFFSTLQHVTLRDLTGFTQVRLMVNKRGVAGATGSKIALRYATSYATSVGSYSTIGTSAVECATDGTDVHVASSWITLAAGATGDCFLAIVGSGGDGAADPQFGAVHAEFR